jgi:hypothetical protein
MKRRNVSRLKKTNKIENLHCDVQYSPEQREQILWWQDQIPLDGSEDDVRGKI